MADCLPRSYRTAGDHYEVFAGKDVRQVSTGYAVKIGDDEIVIPFERAQPSEDEHFHICIWGGEPKCFFAPTLGT